MANINQMITELYEKFIKTTPKQVKETKVSLRQFFIYSYVKEGIFKDMTPFVLKQGNLDDVLNLSAQITYKLLTSEQKAIVENQYKSMTDEQLKHLKNL